MPDFESKTESREDVLHVPNLYDFFCQRTADDMRSHSSKSDEAPAVSFAFLLVTVLAAFVLYVLGRPGLAKATFVLFGVLMVWTIWGVIIRSSEQLSQKADNIRSGVFPPAAGPYVVARLKWWNHLVVPRRWGKHSRLFDRTGRLERKIEETEKKISEAITRAGGNVPYAPPTDAEIAELADQLNTFNDRSEYEAHMAAAPNEVDRLKSELTLYRALLNKTVEMSEKLDRIEKLAVVFHNVSREDLSQIVSESIQLLEERRLLVLNVDTIDPEDFIDMVTVRTT